MESSFSSGTGKEVARSPSCFPASSHTQLHPHQLPTPLPHDPRMWPNGEGEGDSSSAGGNKKVKKEEGGGGGCLSSAHHLQLPLHNLWPYYCNQKFFFGCFLSFSLFFLYPSLLPRVWEFVGRRVMETNTLPAEGGEGRKGKKKPKKRRALFM